MKSTVKSVHQLTVGAALRVLLADLRNPYESSCLQLNEASGTQLDVVAAIDETQLRKFIWDLVRQQIITMVEPPGNGPARYDEWIIDSHMVRNALVDRIKDVARLAEERRHAVALQEQRLEQEKRALGRYTLDEAAAAPPNEDKGDLLAKLKNAANAMDLPVFNAREKQRLTQTKMPANKYHEAYWDDLNAWLAAYEPRISFRFDCPEVEPDFSGLVDAPDRGVDAIEVTAEVLNDDYGPDEFICDQKNTGSPKQTRRRLLDREIDMAVQRAGGQDSTMVWIELTKIALDEEGPFSGVIQKETGALEFTNGKNVKEWFTNNALKLRLSRRKRTNN